MEVGPRDVKNGQVVLVRRDNGQKLTEKVNGLAQRVQEVLEQVPKTSKRSIVANWCHDGDALPK